MMALFSNLDIQFVTRDVDLAFTRFNNRRGLRHSSVLEEREFGDSIALRDGKRPQDGYYNRVIGFSETDAEHLDAMVDWYREGGTTGVLSLAPWAHTVEVKQRLADSAWRYRGLDWTFCLRLPQAGRGLPGAPPVERITATTLEEFFAHLQETGVTIDQALVADVGGFYVGANFENFVVRESGAVIASASLFLHEGVAWLSNAITLEGFRGRGCQGALLQSRVSRAAELGCRFAFTDAEFGSASHRNILRAGFELAWVSVEFDFRA